MNRQLVGVALLVILFPLPSRAFEFRTVALTGQQAPGTAPGVTYTNLLSPVINDAVELAFRAGVGGVNFGLFSEGGGSLHKVMRQDDPIVGSSPARNFGLPNSHVFNAAGQSAFVEGLTTTAIFVEEMGAYQQIIRANQQLIGFPNGSYLSMLGSPLINDLGEIAFTAFLNEPTDESIESIWSNRGGVLQPVIRLDEDIPGTTTRIRNLNGLFFNGVGSIAIHGSVDGLGSPHAGWTDAGGTFTEVFRRGQQAFGFPTGVNYDTQWSELRLNNAGHVAFRSTLIGTGINSSNDLALWEGPVNNYRVVLQKGDNAPGTLPGTVFGDFYTPTLDGKNRLSFIARLAGPGVTAENETSVWGEGDSGLRLLAREGAPAPGTESGTVFGDLERLGNAFGPIANSAGQVAFEASLHGPAITGANADGIWVTDLTGELRLVVRTGDLFDVNDDPLVEEFRTVSSVDLSNFGHAGEEGTSSPLNSPGQLALRLAFTDSSRGIFVIETAVPEPATYALGLATLCPAMCRRRTLKGCTGLRSSRWICDSV